MNFPIRAGSPPADTRPTQEWLSLRGHAVVIDGAFGPATRRAVTAYQRAAALPTTGEVDSRTWLHLTMPLALADAPLPPFIEDVGVAAVELAKQHLAQHPREVGGQNRGPWVRHYMGGNEGAAFAWCAGFACHLLTRAFAHVGRALPIRWSWSCDELATRARDAGLLTDAKSASHVPPGSLFLVRGAAPGDWTHTGLVLSDDGEVIHTCEGNTNDDGAREGYEVCARYRGKARLDVVIWP